ncbi:MAG: carbon storage regulator CsrA [Acidobacteriota bacterium]
MLVFTRKSGESLMIGDEVEVKILSVGSDSVKVGITAPRSVPVHRREVYDTIVAQNLAASRSGVPSADLVRRLKEQRRPTSGEA